MSACTSNKGETPTSETLGVDDGLYTIETVYAKAKELGYTGTLEDFKAEMKGEKGDKGDKGEDGKDGADGQDGVDGKSAYELYCEANPEYTGTLEEWLDSLKGTDGKDGVDGVNGQDGKDGENGENGQDGKDGKDGVDGKSAYELYCEAYPEYKNGLPVFFEF